ncbi:hypothetical protein FRX31_025360 [Thalictrum thalictroides]|uniref:Reverse transcriptase zinc-binding domain n=1 Tax=Thalictrum thalictroides TaxID=46969 RepID=A0A7J6VJH3_THATH|nr:hypothetical protein FRX31_025360 [Thalictrum thalictroides]
MKDGSVRDHYGSGNEWELHLRRSLFRENERAQLNSIMVLLANCSLNDEEDEWEWGKEKSKVYSVSSGYATLDEEMEARGVDSRQHLWKSVWETKVPTNIKFFMWVTRQLWEDLVTVKGETRLALNNCSDVKAFLLGWTKFNSREVAFHIWEILPAAVLWVIWRTRNETIFNEGEVVYEKMVQAVKASVWSWLIISNKGMETRNAFKFTDLIYGWRLVMNEVW